MSDLGFDHVEAPRHHREQAFETDCFDSDVVRKRYGIDLEQHCWAEIRNTGNLYKHLTAFLGKHATHSFEPCVGVKELSCAEEMFGDDEPPKTVNLNCGLGLTTMKHTTAWGQLVSIKALHQRRGPIVGGRCGAETWENLVIFVEGSENKNALQDFLKAVVNHEAEPSLNEYTIYRWHVEHSYWRHAATKTSRSIDSVVLPRVSKDKIIADLDAFLTKETFRFYTSHGIPYKRSYLFYGVPGAGKTSLLTAIAGKYRRNLCIMQPTDPRFTDDTLADAIKEAPRRSIIVLEDVDALFHKNREAKNAKMTISFSGLLNALDGIGNPDGQIFVLTTNFRENLDDALIRNGRVDMHLEFCHATAEQMEQLFRAFYPNSAETQSPTAAVSGLTEPPLAVAFRKRMEETLGSRAVSMAALQHFFIRHMNKSPSDVINAVPSILEDLNEKALAGEDKKTNEGKDVDDDEALSDERKEAEKDDDKPSACACAKSKETKRNETKPGSVVPSEASKASNNVVHVHVYNSA